MSVYPYAKGDRLVERNTYQYTPFVGRAFLNAWRESRIEAKERLGHSAAGAPAAAGGVLPEVGAFRTGPLLELLHARLASGWDPSAGAWLDRLVQRFEVTKRLHRAYGADLRAVDREDFRELALYVRFAEVLEAAYAASGSLVYLNALLKVLDTLCSQAASLERPLASRIARLVEVEGRLVDDLAHRVVPASEGAA